MTQTVIAIDAMSGDHGPGVTVPASLRALKKYPELKLILVGDQKVLSDELARHGGQAGERLQLQHASQVVGMDEAPSSALRGNCLLYTSPSPRD